MIATTPPSLVTPLRYYGGKQTLARWIVGHFPPHRVYVEPFGGSAACLFAKAPAELEVYNDVWQMVVNFYRVLRDRRRAAELARLCDLTPHSRREHAAACAVLRDGRASALRRAWAFFVASRQGFSGRIGHGWGHSVGDRNKIARAAVTAVARLQACHHRLRLVQIEERPALEILERYDGRETLFYVDPPYVHATRTGTDRYAHELADADHAALVDVLRGLRGLVALSGYAHPLYEALERAGWGRVDRLVQNRAVGRTRAAGTVGRGNCQRRRVESLWLNPALQRAQP